MQNIYQEVEREYLSSSKKAQGKKLNNFTLLWLRRRLFILVSLLLFYTRGMNILNFLLNKADVWSKKSSPKGGATGENGNYSSLGRALERGFLILYYHRINEDNDPYFPATPTSTFEEQIKYLTKNYRILPLDEIVEQAQRGRVPQNAIAITFDDGYKDNLTCAYPVLKKYSASATIFLTTRYMDSELIPLWDKVSYIFKRTPKRSLDINIQEPKSYSLNTIKERVIAMYGTLMGINRCRSEEDKRYWLDWLSKTLEVEDFRELSSRMLAWDEVRFMKDNGISFGAHTVTHPDLTKVTVNEAVWQISNSKKELEERLGVEINSFAYPRGDFDDRVKGVVREAGFAYACATISGANRNGEDLFALRRISSLEVPLHAFPFLLEWARYFPQKKNKH